MFADNKQSGRQKVRMSIVQVIGIVILIVALFGIFISLIIYDKQLDGPGVLAIAGINIFIILILTFYIFVRELMDKQDEDFEKIESMEFTDELTQLFNRRYFNTLFERELSRAIRYKKNLCCVIIEIDYYREIKDKYGYKVRDEILQDTAENLKDDLRVNDILARDDDRLICLLPETDFESGLYVSRRLRSLVERSAFSSGIDDKKLHITASVGITYCKPYTDEEIDIHKIVDTAYKALDDAKKKGGNRVEFHFNH